VESSITYKPVGRCIYCGASDGKLTREHIIPFGLGGSWILPRASCKACAAITAKVEQFCLRPMLGRFRIQMELPTRRPGERPKAPALEIVRADGLHESKPLPIEEHPITCVGFDWAAPRLLDGKPPINTFEGRLIVRYAGADLDLLKHAEGKGDKVKLGTFGMTIFARMLAKIGHSYAIAHVPPNSFEPMLPALILGKADHDASYLVGGDKSGWQPKSVPCLHSVYLQDCISGGVTYTLARITLFEIVGMPRYHVVVGRKVAPPAGTPIFPRL
jgi:hypothetical protein